MRSLVLLLIFSTFFIPIGVFAYGSPEDLLVVESNPPVDSRLVYKLQLDPKLSSENRANMLSLWGGPLIYRTCVKLTPEERVIYLAKLKGIIEGPAMVIEVTDTKTFGSKFSSIDSDSSKVDKTGFKSLEVIKVADRLRSKNLVK